MQEIQLKNNLVDMSLIAGGVTMSRGRGLRSKKSFK